jgi:hypothetical protein
VLGKNPPALRAAPFTKGGVVSPLLQRGARGDFTASAVMYEYHMIRFRYCAPQLPRPLGGGSMVRA